MERWLLDSNAVISLLTDRNEAQQKEVVLAFQKAENGEIEIVLHQQVLSEMVFTLLNLYGVARDKVAGILRDMIEHPGVVVENEINWQKLLQYWPSIFKDFGDAMISTVAEETGYPIFTFDKTFGKKLKKIKAVWVNTST